MIKNKIALITGGSRGLGRDMAISTAKKGLDIVITYQSDKAAAQAVVAEIEKNGRKAIALQLDVSMYDNYEPFFTEKLIPALAGTFQAARIDYLVNNAGQIAPASFTAATISEFKDMVHMHMMAPFFMSQHAVKIMNDGGGIINISSGLTRFATPGFAAYAAMKGGVEVLTKYMAKELGPRKIRANVVAPGAIETDIMGGAVRDNKDLNKALADDTALGRVGLPGDVGGVVAFLCSEEAYWINAQRIEVSGGAML